MDKERAKFVLRSFRPDGADVDDADFAEALRLATVDREVGEWLVRERAFDAEFAENLARVELPEGLRASVLLAMVQNGSEFPHVDLEEDKRMNGAMASIEVPSGLRSRILESMEQTAAMERRKTWNWRLVGVPLAAAAGIALAFMFLSNEQQTETSARNLVPTQKDRITLEEVQVGFVRTLEAPAFSLDKTDAGHSELVRHLINRGLPCGDMKFPPGLEHLAGLGCRELKLGDKRGSLICFEGDGETVHLVIFMRKDIEGTLPDMEHPNLVQSERWASASWGNEKYAYALMSAGSKDQLAQFF